MSKTRGTTRAPLPESLAGAVELTKPLKNFAYNHGKATCQAAGCGYHGLNPRDLRDHMEAKHAADWAVYIGDTEPDHQDEWYWYGGSS